MVFYSTVKSLVLLLILPLQLFAQGTWREVSTPPGWIDHIDFFEGDKGYIASRTDSVDEFGGFTKYFLDTVYFTEDGGNSWSVFQTFTGFYNPFVGLVKVWDFLSPTNWIEVINDIDASWPLTVQTFNVFINYQHLPVPLPVPIDSSSGGISYEIVLSMADDFDMYCRVSQMSYYNNYELYHWISDSSSWEKILDTYDVREFQLDPKTKNCFAFIQDSLTYRAVFMPSFDVSQMRDVSVPFHIPAHITDSFWISYKNQYYSVTSNNGNTWASVDSVNNNIDFVRFTKDGYGFLKASSGDTSILYRTTDFGLTWIMQSKLTSYFGIQDISIVDSLTAYLAIGGKLYKTTDGGGSVLLEIKKPIVPRRPPLTIYPNPATKEYCTVFFSPLQFVTNLRIYDMLGRIVSSQGMPKETAEFILDVGDLPTGCYHVVLGSNSTILVRQ